MSHKSRQDYIAKVRYQNDLPPPPCPPKLLKYDFVQRNNAIDSSALLSSMFRRGNFADVMTLNNSFGMELDLLEVPGLLESNFKPVNVPLHLDDQLLMSDPSLSSMSKTSGSNVSFLRRTQYISERSSSPATNTPTKKPQKEQEERTDPEAQLRAVEDTFDSVDAEVLKHPTKKHLTAKKIWNFLPDTTMLDQNYLSVRFVGSASILKDKKFNPSQKRKLDEVEGSSRFMTSIYRPIDTESSKWVSFYSTTSEQASDLKEKLDNGLIGSDFVFEHQRDYDVNFQIYKEMYDELAITFDPDSDTAYYIPIQGKLDLKRRRVAPSLESFVKEHNVDEIDLSVRDPSTSETILRDNARVQFDPMEYAEMNVDDLDDLKNEEKADEVSQGEREGPHDARREDIPQLTSSSVQPEVSKTTGGEEVSENAI